MYNYVFKTVFFCGMLYLTLCQGTQDGGAHDYCLGHFSHCICTDEYVECHNETKLTDIRKLYHYIKDNIVNFTITGSNFPDLPTNFLGSCKGDTSLVLKDLKHIVLSNNNISTIDGKTFHCMNQLVTMDLSHNSWMIDYHPNQIGYFTSLPKLEHLDLTNAFDEVWNGSIHLVKLASMFENTDMSSLVTLKLGHNELFTFSVSAANSFCELTELQTLDLSHNNLTSPSMPTREMCLENLQVLDLSHNYITALPKEFMTKIERLYNLDTVHLDNNKFSCDCRLIDTWKWLKSNNSKVVNKDELKCAYGFHSSYIGKPIISLSLEDLQCQQSFPGPSNVAAKAVIGIIFSVIAITIVAFLIINRHKVATAFGTCKRKVPKIRNASHSGYSTVKEVPYVENV